MIKLNPRIGIGNIRFGMKRDEVIAMMGSKQTWEHWMGGNLNDSFYPGIILLRGWRMANPVDDGGGKDGLRLRGLLSPREHGILQLIARDHSNKRVAQELGITPETVKSQAKHIFIKLGAQTRMEAVSKAVTLGLI